MTNALANLLFLAVITGPFSQAGQPAQPSGQVHEPPPLTVTGATLDRQRGALEITLHNHDASHTLVAWTLDVQVKYAAGVWETLRHGVDCWEQATGLLNSPPARFARVIPAAGTVSYTVRVGGKRRLGEPVDVGEAHPTSAIAADVTSFGDPEMVRVTLMTRARDAGQLDALAELLQDAHSQGPTPREAVRRAIAHIEAHSALGSWRTPAHRKLSLALERADNDRANLHDDLAALIKHTRAQAAAVKRVTLPAFLDTAREQALP